MAVYGIGAMYGGADDQTDNFIKMSVACVGWSPTDAPAAHAQMASVKTARILRRLAVRQSVRSAYTSKIKQLLGGEKAKEFEDLYALRSCFLHDGSGRGNLGGAADAALEIGLELLLADIT